MTTFKLLLLWWLIGAVVQTVMMLRLRQKYGRYMADVSTRIVLGRWWLLKTFTSCFFWPLGVYAWFFHKPPLTTQMKEKLDAIAERIIDHCPDCGEPLESHEDLSQ